jgi:uncharacterized protein (TIGR03437 family)
VTCLLAGTALHTLAQEAAPVAIEWRNAGNLSLDRGLNGVASGTITRVWYSADGTKLYALGVGGRVFETSDFEQWTISTAQVPAPAVDGFSRSKPEAALRVRRSLRERAYAAGRFVYRSDDDGLNWTNLTSVRGESILGDGITDIAASPVEADEVTVATQNGIWRSIDAGLSWVSLNDGLPNFPAARILSLPNGSRGMRIAVDGSAFEWQPGERKAWRALQADEFLLAETQRNARLSQQLGFRITASAAIGDVIYAGSFDGRLLASSDRGASWRPFKIQETGAITRIVADPQDPRIAVASAGTRPAELNQQNRAAHVLRTVNGGGFWDDLTDNLPDVPVSGVTFERASGALYAATARGVFFTSADLNGLGPATPWRRISPDSWGSAPASDVLLGSGGHQLYASVEGLGVFAASAPHRRGSPRLVNAADFSTRAAAPGSLLTLIGGGEVNGAQVGASNAPVLASTQERSEIHVPFDVQGSSLSLALQPRAGGAPMRFSLPLEAASPAVFVDRDGTPMVLDGETGVLLDSLSPARSGSRVQILMTGLGRVRPEWPAGVAAPADGPPSVVARVRAWIDGNPVEVTRSVLAPGYIGFYLVEIELPKIVNYGPAELYLDADGRESNRVRIFIEP